LQSLDSFTINPEEYAFLAFFKPLLVLSPTAPESRLMGDIKSAGFCTA
jgi:hypothetical protein